MSYRDMRNFTETMRALGYPRLISMENFRVPNFPLVAEILSWLVKRYDYAAELHPDIDTQQDRVIFIKMAAQFMATRAHIRLNTKKLYQADGYAVKELLKVTSALYEAMRRDPEVEESGDTEDFSTLDVSKLNDIKEARRLASVITGHGASLFDLVGREVDLREARNIAIGRQLELHDVEVGIRASAKAVEAEILRTASLLESIAADEANLEAKIEKRRGELERNQKRLATLQSVRPAYMDEYERLEEDLIKLYADYMGRFRNLAFLESLYGDYCRSELEKAEETEMSLRRMSERIKEDEQKVDIDEEDLGGLGGGADDDDDASVTDEDEEDEEEAAGGLRRADGRRPERRMAPPLGGEAAPQKRPKAPPSGVRRTQNFGSMGNNTLDEEDDEDEDDEDDDEDGESEEDSDEDLDDSDIEVGDSQEEDGAEGTTSKVPGGTRARPLRPAGAGSRVRAPQSNGDSDNDF